MALGALKFVWYAYLVVSMVRVVLLWGEFRCEQPVQVWILAHQFLTLLVCLGYQLVRHFHRRQGGAGNWSPQLVLLVPLDGSCMQRAVFLPLLFIMLPAFLASCCLGLYCLVKYWVLSSTFQSCWPDDDVNEPQVLAFVLSAGCLCGGYLLLFNLCTICRRSQMIRARSATVAAGRAAVRPMEYSGAGLLGPELLRYCPEAECDKDASVHCSICQENCREGQLIRTVVVCGHQYHRECLELWLQNRPTCPNCNQDVTTPVL